MPEVVTTQPAQPVQPRFTIPEEPAPASPAQPAEGDKPVQNAADQAPATPSEGEAPKEEETPEQAAKRAGRRFERRLDKAYRKAADAQARAELLEKQLAEERSKAPAQVHKDSSAPKLEDFDDIQKYAAAVEKNAKEQALKEYQEEQRKSAQTSAQQKLSEAWESRVEKAVGKYEDFETVVGEITPALGPWAMALMEADNGHDIAYYLGKHLDEARSIAALSPLSQVRAIGRLEAKLAAEPVKPKTPSKAPAPIVPLTGTSPVASDVPSDQDDMGAWMKKRQRQVHGK